MNLRSGIVKLREKLFSGKKLSSAGKRNLILCASLLVICTAVFLNFGLSGGDGSVEGIIAASAVAEESGDAKEGDSVKVLGESVEVSAVEDKENYFAVSVINRERVRDESLETLREVADGELVTKEDREKALAQMSVLADCMQKEVNIENLVMAKGFEDCVAVVSATGVDVVVKTRGLLPSEVAKIKEIAVEQTGFSVSEVRIIEHE